MPRRVAPVVLAAGLVLVACSSATTSGSAAPTGSGATGATTASAASTRKDAGSATTRAPSGATSSTTTDGSATSAASTTAPASGTSAIATIDGMPPVIDATNVYSQTAPGDLSPAVRSARPLVYVPTNTDGTLQVIDPATYSVIATYKVGKLSQHVVPSWDLKTLYVNASGANRLVPIDPTTGTPGTPIPVDAPYNLYFTPDGRFAMVMAERLNRIDLYDPVTWKKVRSITVPCRGINHADWSADGSYFLATCEFTGQMLKVETTTMRVLGRLTLPERYAQPQDVRVLPNGTTFVVADMMSDGIWVIDGPSFTVQRLVKTGAGAHGIYPSRDASVIYVSNRGRHGDEKRRSRQGEGSVSVLDARTLDTRATWTIPGGGSPDMGGVTTDGRELWLSGRFDNVVYVFDTATGSITHTIPVGRGPHGLSVFPQPGRYSLGHTGNYR